MLFDVRAEANFLSDWYRFSEVFKNIMQIGMREVGQLSICRILEDQDIYFEDNDAAVIIRQRDWQGHKVRMTMATF